MQYYNIDYHLHIGSVRSGCGCAAHPVVTGPTPQPSPGSPGVCVYVCVFSLGFTCNTNP